jgi:hypothetical protein
MDWDNYIKLLSAMFGLLGAGLVAYSAMAPEEKADKITGFNFVAIAFVLTALSLFVQKNWRPSRWAFVLLVVFSGALVIVVWCIGDDIYREDKLVMEKLGEDL